MWYKNTKPFCTTVKGRIPLRVLIPSSPNNHGSAPHNGNKNTYERRNSPTVPFPNSFSNHKRRYCSLFWHFSLTHTQNSSSNKIHHTRKLTLNTSTSTWLTDYCCWHYEPGIASKLDTEPNAIGWKHSNRDVRNSTHCHLRHLSDNYKTLGFSAMSSVGKVTCCVSFQVLTVVVMKNTYNLMGYNTVLSV